MCWTTCLEPISNENIVALTHAFSLSYFGSFCKKIQSKQWTNKNNVFFPYWNKYIRKPYTIYALVGCGGVHSYSFYSGLCLDLLRLGMGPHDCSAWLHWSVVSSIPANSGPAKNGIGNGEFFLLKMTTSYANKKAEIQRLLLQIKQCCAYRHYFITLKR